jgi:hypothetical protein
MYIFYGDKSRIHLGQAIAPVQELTQLDVMSPQIDVFAQRALFRMLKADPESNLAARSMIYAVKLKLLGGIYKENQRVPALRAQKIGKGWWQLIPKNEDAICLSEPSDLKPIVLYRDKIRSTPSRLDPALKRAWMACGIAQLTPPPYKPKAFPQHPKLKPLPLPDYPPSAERPRCDDRELQMRLEECDKKFNECKSIADDWRFKEMLECGADRECRNNAISSLKKRQALCASQLIACQERAKC